MIHWKNPRSIRTTGMKLAGVNNDWLVVGEWDQIRLRDELIGKIQYKQLRDAFGPRRVGEVHCPSCFGYVHLIVVEEDDDILDLVRKQAESFDDGEEIDDTEYHNMIGPLIDEHWRGLSVQERLQLIFKHGAEPSQLHADTVCENLYSQLLPDLENS